MMLKKNQKNEETLATPMTELEKIKRKNEITNEWLKEYKAIVDSIDRLSNSDPVVTNYDYEIFSLRKSGAILTESLTEVLIKALQQELIRFENEGFEEWAKKEGYEL